MCRFIYVGLPDGVDPAELDQQEPIRLAGPSLDPELIQSLEENEVLFSGTSRHCDCSTVIGSARGGYQKAIAQGEARAKRKGWSATRLERWRNDMRRGHRDKEAEYATEEAAWVTLIESALARTEVKSVLLLALWVGTTPKGTAPIPLSELHAGGLRRLDLRRANRIVR